jgi:hypothetical protein
MKNFKKILALILIPVAFSCIKDPLEDIESGNWNNERSIINITFDNQVGQADVTRVDENSGNIIVAINVDAVPNLSAISLKSLELSYGANASLELGETLSFENGDHSSAISVTSPTGKTREYTIYVTSFREAILGTYNITDLVVFGGTGPEYGGGGVIPMTSKPWVWAEGGGPQAELDNTVTFELEGITEGGNTYGKIINIAGDDGIYADFIYVGDPQTDVNHFYRKIPKGEGTWLRNYTTGNLIITFEDGSTATGNFIGAGTEDLGNGQTKTTSGNALVFNLNGTDDWNSIYSDYDKFVKRPRKYWIDLEKQ